MDMEKVLKGLECCIKSTWDDPFAECEHCPYNEISIYVQECRAVLSADALTLLKEQEAVAVHDPGAYCPKCGWMLYPENHPHHCGNCGQAVKWE